MGLIGSFLVRYSGIHLWFVDINLFSREWDHGNIPVLILSPHSLLFNLSPCDIIDNLHLFEFLKSEPDPSGTLFVFQEHGSRIVNNVKKQPSSIIMTAYEYLLADLITLIYNIAWLLFLIYRHYGQVTTTAGHIF